MKLHYSHESNPGWLTFVIFCLVPLLTGEFFWLALKYRATRLGKLPKSVRLLLLNGLATIFFVSAAFLVGETYYRFIYDTTDSFNYTFASRRWFGKYFHYNSADLRDNVDYPESIPPGKRRVSFVGDSFTVGQGIENVDDRFGNLLRKRHPEWEVEVLAVEGADTGAEIEALQRLVRHQYQMNLVVLVYCLNDIGDIFPKWRAEHLFQDWETRPWIVQNSYFANTYYFRLKARFDPNIPDYFATVSEDYNSSAWDIQQQRLAYLRQMVAAYNGQLMVVTFPFLHALGPNYRYQFAHDKLNDFWRKQGVPHLDLLAIYQTHSADKLTVNRLDAHPNEFAHALAADAIDKFIATNWRTNNAAVPVAPIAPSKQR